MYINLVLGAVALFAVWLLLRKLLVKEEPPKPAKVDDAATILAAELQKRQAKDAAASSAEGSAFELVRDAAAARLEPVVGALEDMHSSLPEENRDRLSWQDNGDNLLVHMAGTAQKADHSLRVAWRLPDMDLDAAKESLDRGRGLYVLRDMHSKKEESVGDLKECVRRIAVFIAEALA